ncbi:phosphate ABC transporter permease PstA [Cloacibacillus evryensis]|uniref:Phosphate transport system permease protein PstA n=1 Tax=Cloacibacillus evryensis TaxID=508460 RepID=A0AAW5KA24_9BACT|nr:phosphate ABC transporter permease PstA [Cloacibacillus evryensis]MCQ4763853.1 phosphate ABC transporter permease PstA [Cloacibacillus evryensis]MCQ4814693.1 phosphate ABC transporter permease PstA [Cloacibacillus evryensis]MEA5034560.1 phosphate ABC transporter permease PstA [Cloacibacillus evryensis]
MNRTFIRKIYDRLMTLVFCLFALLLVAVIGAVAAFLIKNGAATLSWEFLSEPPKDGMLAGGILTPLVGTMQLVLVSMGVALPVGIMTGLYFAEYAKDTWIVSLMRISIRSLAGVPSVIFGLFGLSLFVVFMQFGSCLLSAGLTLACLSLPLVVTVAEQAFLAVPQDYRDASYALGATKYQTIMKVVLPSAASTIITGAILAVGRVAGETAPIMFTGAAYFAPDIAKSLFSQVMALPYHIYVLATSATDPEAAAPIEYGAILVLIGLVMGTSAIGVVARARLSERNGR